MTGYMVGIYSISCDRSQARWLLMTTVMSMVTSPVTIMVMIVVATVDLSHDFSHKHSSNSIVTSWSQSRLCYDGWKSDINTTTSTPLIISITTTFTYLLHIYYLLAHLLTILVLLCLLHITTILVLLYFILFVTLTIKVLLFCISLLCINYYFTCKITLLVRTYLSVFIALLYYLSVSLSRLLVFITVHCYSSTTIHLSNDLKEIQHCEIKQLVGVEHAHIRDLQLTKIYKCHWQFQQSVFKIYQMYIII